MVNARTKICTRQNGNLAAQSLSSAWHEIRAQPCRWEGHSWKKVKVGGVEGNDLLLEDHWAGGLEGLEGGEPLEMRQKGRRLGRALSVLCVDHCLWVREPWTDLRQRWVRESRQVSSLWESASAGGGPRSASLAKSHRPFFLYKPCLRCLHFSLEEVFCLGSLLHTRLVAPIKMQI